MFFGFCQGYGNESNSSGREVMLSASLLRNAYENQYVIHP